MKRLGKASVINLSQLIIMAALVVGCTPSVKRHELNLDQANLTWRGDYDPVTHHMSYTGEWAGCGWWFGDDSIKPAADFSEYDQLVVAVDNIVGDSVKLYLNVRYTSTNDISSGTAPIVDGRATMRVDLNPDNKSHVLEIYVMSQSPCELTLGNSYFCEAIKYGKPRELKALGGFIDASEFNGYSDDAMVSFNYSVEGEMTYDAESGAVEPMNNWGIGKIYSSADIAENVCPGRQIILKQLGEQSFTCLLGDIRYMLDIEGDDGRRGLYWKVWIGGHLTDAQMINATISEAISH